MGREVQMSFYAGPNPYVPPASYGMKECKWKGTEWPVRARASLSLSL